MKTYVFPGQGSQQKGMGGNLFDEFKDLTKIADAVLGYSIKKLCIEDPDQLLGQTQYTQPALFTVNALTYLSKICSGGEPDYVAGHSLGEYNALFASGAFDFETGLKMVQKRGALMALAQGGGMAAVIGLSAEKIEDVIIKNKLESIQIANHNSPSQTVISGPRSDITRINTFFESEGGRYIPLNVSGAFHSRYMSDAKNEFEKFINIFTFSALAIPVISNVTARPYHSGEIKKNLADQIIHSVKWTESVRYLMGRGEMEFEEVGPGNVLTRLIATIRKEATPLIIPHEEHVVSEQAEKRPETKTVGREAALPGQEVAEVTVKESVIRKGSSTAGSAGISAESLGDVGFKQDYGIKYAYLTGSMYRGIASKAIVVKMAKAGMMGFFGTGGLSLGEIERSIQDIQKEIPNGQAYGMNLLHNPADPAVEEKTVDLYLKYGIKTIEASAYMGISPSLVRYRANGLLRDGVAVIGNNRIIAKVSRPEVAEAFLSPAPPRLVEKLIQESKISGEQAALLKEIPMADDVCVEADSGGHTDGGVAYALMPAMLKLRDEMMKKYRYAKKVRIGAAGGIGTPEAAAAAFVLGADFILTGSINQCTVEASTSDAVKDMLQQMNVQDTEYAPAGDMFEIGAKVQVLKKGVFFPARANKLYDLYMQNNSLDQIDEKTRKQLQERYFKRTFEDIYKDCRSYYPPLEIERAERNSKQKMAIIFKWYFGQSTRHALNGTPGEEVDYQIQCGPALGAFNQWIKGTALENWRNRHVDEIAVKLMNETANVLKQRFQQISLIS
jgi:trans-AT polyketide synthase/acyltransferase/oxidoreductase domain-containing protein